MTMSGRLAVLGLTGMILGGCQHSGQPLQYVSASEAIATRSITIAAGASTNIDFAVALNEDCSLASQQGSFRVAKEPTNGRLTVKDAVDHPSFSKPNPRSACNARRVPGRAITYRPADGFVGVDSFEYDRFLSGGTLIHVRVVVNVK